MWRFLPFYFNLSTTLMGENFAQRKFQKVKISWKFRDKISRMSSNDAFGENATFTNDYFK